ncbi:MAG: DUF488 family protein [Alphaproteobacteria bacterium]
MILGLILSLSKDEATKPTPTSSLPRARPNGARGAMLAGRMRKGKPVPESRSNDDGAVTIHTIGHSKHPIARFVSLLKDAGIEALVDVRSHPGSRFNPQFNRTALARALGEAGIDYRHLGDALGGKPQRPALLDASGKPDYAKMRSTPEFRAGIDALIEAAHEATTAIMCAEEDPARCHRTLLVTPALIARGVEVRHLRGDGRIVPHPAPAAPKQADLFNP